MHSAYLLTERGWEITTNVDKILNHLGEAVLNETPEAVQDNLQMIAARENGFAEKWGDRILITERPVFSTTDDKALNELNTHGFVLVRYTDSFRTVEIPGEKRKTTRRVQVPYRAEGYDEASTKAYAARYEKWKGCVAVNQNGAGCDSYWRVTRDPAVFAIAEIAQKKADRKEKLRQERAPITAYELENAADSLSRQLGCGVTKAFRLWHFWTWVAAHDQAFGLRETNKKIAHVAKKWCSNRERNKGWMKRWCDEAVVTRTDERLAKVVRQKKTETPTKEPALAS